MHRSKIHQILLNLFEDAIHAIRESVLDKIISVTTSIEISDTRECAKVLIVNTGPQIPEDAINNIYNPIYTTKKKGLCAGLGLSITQELVSEHKGELQILNIPNGVGYILLLPIVDK